MLGDRRTLFEVVSSRVEPEFNPPFKYPSRQLGMGWESLESASRLEESSVAPPFAPSGLLPSSTSHRSAFEYHAAIEQHPRSLRSLSVRFLKS